MTFDINIASPRLAAGQKFRVFLIGGSQGNKDEGLKDSNSFQLTRADNDYGHYVVWARLVQADGTICEPGIFYQFDYKPSPCFTVSNAEIQLQTDGSYAAVITFQAPANPSTCGYVFRLQGTDGDYVNKVYATLPASPVKITVSNYDHQLQIFSRGCDGVLNECKSQAVPKYSTSCTPLTIVSAAIIKRQSNYYIRISFSQSTPASSSVVASYRQTNFNYSGNPDAGSLGRTFALTNAPLEIRVNPNTNAVIVNESRKLIYKGSLIDRCRKTIPFTAEGNV